MASCLLYAISPTEQGKLTGLEYEIVTWEIVNNGYSITVWLVLKDSDGLFAAFPAGVYPHP